LQAVQQPDCHRAGIVVTPENVGATIAIEIARSRNHPVERHHAKTGSLDNFKSYSSQIASVPVLPLAPENVAFVLKSSA
jgi:hypothetical protein